MDAGARLSADPVDAPALIATEHVQRYRWAGELVRGLRVLDLCRDGDYGAQILSELAARVDGGEIAHSDLREYDAIVCFEAIERAPRPEELVDALAEFARRGGRVLASVASNDLAGFDYDGVNRLWDRFPEGRRYLQFAAEGMLLVDAERADHVPPPAVELTLTHHGEPPYADTFLLAVNVPPDALAAAQASMRVTIAPWYNRALRSLQLSNDELWHVNRRLGRQIEEIRAALDRGEAPVSAIRLGPTSAASAVVRMLDERDAIRAERDALRAERDAAAAERDQLRSLLDGYGDPRLIPELVAERERLGTERGLAWHRYEQLRNRRIVRLALALARLSPGRGRASSSNGAGPPG